MLAAVLRPWHSARTWRELAQVCTDLFVGTIAFTVIVTLLATSVGLAVIVPVGIVVVAIGGATEDIRVPATETTTAGGPAVP